MSAARIGVATTHLIARENVDVLCRRALFIGDPVHIQAIQTIIEVGQRRSGCDICFPNAALRS